MRYTRFASSADLYFITKSYFSRSMTQSFEGTKESRRRVSERGFYKYGACDRRRCTCSRANMSRRNLSLTQISNISSEMKSSNSMIIWEADIRRLTSQSIFIPSTPS